MDLFKYLERIACHQYNRIDEAYLYSLHEGHIFNIPFENLDVQFKKLFYLAIVNIYKKVGPVTIFNNKFIEKSDEGRIEKMIYNETELRKELLLNFGIKWMY
jgi:hypothetical protein